MIYRASFFITLLVGLTFSGWPHCFGSDTTRELDMKRDFTHIDFMAFSNQNPAVALNMLKWNIKFGEQTVVFLDLTKQIFSQWARKDVAAAQSWLDRQLAAQVFDENWLASHKHHTNHFREQLEAEVLINLLDTDLTAIKARLASMNEQMRINLVSASRYWNIPSEKENTLAQLVRFYLNDNARLEFFASQGGLAMDGDFARVDAYMENVKLLVDEKKRIIESAAAASIGFMPCRLGGKINAQHIKAMRDWLISKGFANTADRLTGENLAGAVFPKDNIYYSEAKAHCINFAEACALAEEFWKLSGNDEVLIGFLERSNPWESIDKATELAWKIADKEKRLFLLRKFNPQTMMKPVEKNSQPRGEFR